MKYETIIYQVEENICKITMNLPELRNPLSEQLTKELVNALKQADEDQEVRAIILTGSGKAFSAGGNLNDFKSHSEKSLPELHFEGRENTELFKLGESLRTPLISSVNGPALGGGTGIIAMSHIAIASSKAKLGTTELRLGLVPFIIMPWVRRALFGDRNAMEMMLTAEILSASDHEKLVLSITLLTRN